MPALYWCGRRWRTSTDEMTFSSILHFVLTLPAGIMALASTKVTSNGPVVSDCSSLKSVFSKCFIGLGCVDVVCAALYLLIAILSLRGSVFETSKRRLVPYVLYLSFFATLTAFVLSCICIKYALYDGNLWDCKMALRRHMVVGSLALTLSSCLIYSISVVCSFSVSGATEFHSQQEYQKHWWKRCRILCCRCDRSSQENESYREVAQVLALAFRAYDIVPSDLVAGMLLLHGYQQRSLRIMSSRVSFGANPDGYEERVSSQARPVRRLTSEQEAAVLELQQYSRFYMGAYGWLLYEYMHCCTGVGRLCCRDPFMCCRSRPGRHYGTNCFCDVTALLAETNILDEENLLLTSWSNRLFKPVHYVAYDYDSDAIVIAIRGTMSVIDCITDFAATPQVIELKDISASRSPDEYLVHSGMHSSAQYVKRCLEYNGILQQIDAGRYTGKKVVVLGHSLGAGVAMILSTVLWSEYAGLRSRLRCLAYAPPGGTLSEAVVEYSRGFTIGCFMGYDMIPRLAMHTFDTFRESIFDVLAASSSPKSMLLLSAFRTDAIAASIHPASRDPTLPQSSDESTRYRAALRTAACVPAEESRKMYPCETLVHFRKAVEVSRSVCDGGAEDIYVPVFVTPAEVQVLLSSPTMFTDHFPDRFYDVLASTCERLQTGQLDRFFMDTDPAVMNETEAPLTYTSVPIRTSTTSTSHSPTHSHYGSL